MNNHRDLLKKYMKHIIECEGTSFIGDINDPMYGPSSFTKEEVSALCEIRREIEAEKE